MFYTTFRFTLVFLTSNEYLKFAQRCLQNLEEYSINMVSSLLKESSSKSKRSLRD